MVTRATLIAVLLFMLSAFTARAQFITQLPAATTPLSGQEICVLVQSGVTKQTLCSNFGGGGGSVVWPRSGDLVVSNGTNSPAGLAPVNGDCAIGASGVWTTGSCGGGGSPGGAPGSIQYNNNGAFGGAYLNGLIIANNASAPSAYGGASCSDEFITALSYNGAATCNAVTNAFISPGTFASITGTGTLTAGATGAGFTVALGTSTITGTLAAANGGMGLNTSSSTGVPSVSSGTWSIDPDISLSNGGLTLGASGTIGSLTMGNATSGLLTIVPVPGALGTVLVTVPAANGPLASTNYGNNFTVGQTFSSGITASGLSGVTCAYSLVLNSSNAIGTTSCPSGGVTWPTSGDIVVSNSSSSPAGLAPVNGDCVVGSGGSWVAGSCTGTGGGVTSSGTVSSGNIPIWNGTYTLSAAGIAYGTTGNSVLLETGSGGTISSAVCPAGTASAIGCLEVGGGLSVSAGVVQLAANSGATNSFLSSINSSGVPQFTQPAFSNLSGSPSAAQLETNFDAALAAKYAPVQGDCLIGNSTPAWSVAACVTPGGSSGAIQYNNSGSLGGVLITGLVLGAGSSAPTAYGGASCSNEVITALSASGAATCNSITNAYVSSGYFSNITGIGTPNYMTTASGALSPGCTSLDNYWQPASPSGNVTCALPSSPTNGQKFYVTNFEPVGDTYTLTVTSGSINMALANGTDTSAVLPTRGDNICLQYVSSASEFLECP